MTFQDLYLLKAPPLNTVALEIKFQHEFWRGHKHLNPGQAQWLTPVIPVLQEAEAGGSQGQEFETSLTNMLKPNSTKNTKISQVWWCMPVVPATQEAETGETLKPGRWRLQ